MKIVVVGLGYVGLPLAVALARKFAVTGFDIEAERVAQLRSGFDRTLEVDEADLAGSSLTVTGNSDDCRAADVYIVTVPTPVDSNNQPDLTAVLSASRFIASVMDPSLRPTVVFESTVYPGVTEDICVKEIERAGGLVRGRDFRLG